jgi:hypothetical protein
MGTYGNTIAVSSLASTGVMIGFGSHYFGVLAMVLTAVVMVAVGALCLRLGWRRGRPLNGR